MAYNQAYVSEAEGSTGAFTSENGTLDVSDKYKKLMQDSIGDDSIYMRAKDTMLSLFSDLDLTSGEKAQIAAGHVTQLSVALSDAAMKTALAWEKEERDGAYALAKVKADTELSMIQKEKAEQEHALIMAQINKTKAEISAIEDNAVEDVNLKQEQQKQVIASTYQINADAFRKSGALSISQNATTGELTVSEKVDANGNAIYEGYTHQQSLNAERLRIAYEDSKLNHAVNGASTMIGAALTADIAVDQKYFDIWYTAMTGLTTKHSSTNSL